MTRKSDTVLVDLALMGALCGTGCAVCGGSFSLGETVVLALGKWEGKRHVHEREARFDPKTGAFVARET
jgi:hypothetical protein